MNVLDENFPPSMGQLLRSFYKPSLCHSQYCLVYLNVEQPEAAVFVRRLLHHSEFDTQAKRMGQVIRVSHAERYVSLGWAGVTS